MFERLRDAGKLDMPDDGPARALWDMTQEVTTRPGLPAYEISNHARPGAESRHNLDLLALRRICGRRPWRAWPAFDGEGPARAGDRKDIPRCG